MGIPVLLSGLLAVTTDAFRWTGPAMLSVKAIFGICLLVAVVEALRSIRSSGSDAGVRHLRRCQVVRKLYLVLYLLAGARVCYSALGARTIADVLTRLGTDKSLTDFQFYIGCMFAAVCVIRLSSYAGLRPALRSTGTVTSHDHGCAREGKRDATSGAA